MRWYEISIKTTEEAEDAISNILYELGANGVVIEDNEIVTRPNLWDYIDENQFTKRIMQEFVLTFLKAAIF